MDTKTTLPHTVNARTLLLPYALTIVIAMAAIQATIALTGGNITLLSGALTATVAVGALIWGTATIEHSSKSDLA